MKFEVKDRKEEIVKVSLLQRKGGVALVANCNGIEKELAKLENGKLHLIPSAALPGIETDHHGQIKVEHLTP